MRDSYEQTPADFQAIERNREIDTESGEKPDDWADPELWDAEECDEDGVT